VEVVHESDQRARGGAFLFGLAFYLFLVEMALRFWKGLGSEWALASFALSLRGEWDRDGQ